MAASLGVKPFQISNSIDLSPLFQQAFDNANYVDPIFSESPLSSAFSSPSHSIPGTPELLPQSSNADIPDLDGGHLAVCRSIGSSSGSVAHTGSKERSKSRGKLNHKRKREDEKADLASNGLPPVIKWRHIEPAAEHVKVVDVDLQDFRVAKNGFTGYHSDAGTRIGEYALDQMVGPDSLFDFDLLPWNASGELGLSSSPYWYKLDNWCSEVAFTKKQQKGGHRGPLFMLNCGVVAGQGLLKPTTRKQANAKSAAVINKLH
uniref:Uncharacterized protein n=1 Tax=Moniliophthora roreri TaxID=221103 RepID=A0A0W0G260_MONRR